MHFEETGQMYSKCMNGQQFIHLYNLKWTSGSQPMKSHQIAFQECECFVLHKHETKFTVNFKFLSTNSPIAKSPDINIC